MLEFDICFKDKDSDSGEKINQTVLATAKSLKAAMWIKGALEFEWASEPNQEILIPTDPKREFLVEEREVEDDEEDYKLTNDDF